MSIRHCILSFRRILALRRTNNSATEHGGLKEDGTPDKRVGTGEFAQGKVDPVEAGKQGGQTSGGSGDSSSGSSSGGSGRKSLTYTMISMPPLT